MSKYFISAFCAITNGTVNSNHSLIYREPSDGPEAFLKDVYKHYQISYPKFYKMDNLSKLGLICSELLMKNNPLKEKYSAEDIALVIANRSSSLESDTEHQNGISKEDPLASPSVFVYTLANILMGEIAIRNSIKGENSFFIFDKFDADFIAEYTESMLNKGTAKCCVCGWVEFYDNKYEAFLYTVESAPGTLHEEHNAENLKKLFLHDK
jgi:hypothetical protein